MNIKFSHAGDSALLVELDNLISPEINYTINQLRKRIEASNIDGIREVLPTYRSLIIYFNPLSLPYNNLKGEVEEIYHSLDTWTSSTPTRVIEIPVLYGGEYGPDITHIANHNNLTTDEVVEIHSSRDYLVYMLGFTPGFPYLGGIDERIATPRLEEPRIKVPAGSVGIAGGQTGLYPIESPGGWQLLGRTPLKAFNSNHDNPFLLESGDSLRFVPIGTDEFIQIEEAINNDSYEVKVHYKEGN